MNRTVAVTGGIALAAVACLTGCSQIDSLQQVSGVPVNTLQIATDEILSSQNVQVLVSPTCVQPQAKGDLVCKGTTVSKQEIVVHAKNATAATFTLSPGGTPTPAPNGALNMTMVITVGGKQIYSGSVQDVIERSAVKGQ